MPTYGVRGALALLEALHAAGLALLLRRLAPLCTALCRRAALAELVALVECRGVTLAHTSRCDGHVCGLGSELGLGLVLALGTGLVLDGELVLGLEVALGTGDGHWNGVHGVHGGAGCFQNRNNTININKIYSRFFFIV